MPSHANKSTKVAALQLRKAGKSFPFIAKQLWREWKRIIMTKFKPPKNLKELEGRMNLAWKLLSKRKDLLTNLCDSAQRRVEALLEADGGFTKY